MKKLLIIIYSFCSILIAQEKTYVSKLKTLLEIGADDIGKPEYLFDYPGFVSTDEKLNIYVAEKKALTIRIFDKNGNYLKSIGRRGRGPGEFLDITLMTVNKDKELLVFDNFMYRITYFSLEGKYIKEIKYNPEQLNWPRGVIQLNDGTYVLSYYLENRTDFFHFWDKNFSKIISVISDVQLNEDRDENLKNVKYYGFNPTYVDSRDKDIVISKYLYDNKIYLFSYNNHKTSFIKTVPGVSYNKDSYTNFTNDYSDKKFDIDASYINKKFKANIHNLGLGTFILKSGEIVNFVKVEKGKEIIFGFEKYDSKYNFLGFWIIQKELFSDKNRRLLYYGIKVAHKDQEDNFYLIDETEYPKIKKVHID